MSSYSSRGHQHDTQDALVPISRQDKPGVRNCRILHLWSHALGPRPPPHFLHAHAISKGKSALNYCFEFPLKYLVLMKGSAENAVFLFLPEPRAGGAVAIQAPRKEEDSQEQHWGMREEWSLLDPLGYVLRFLTCEAYIFLSEVKVLWNGLEYRKSCLLHCRFEAVFASIYWAK